jgi:hypothetical protein
MSAANYIELSKYTKSLLEHVQKQKKPQQPEDSQKVSVSQTATFFALLYERIRNAVEYRESSLIRRAAIERILKRRLSMNAAGRGEAENIIRELLWARYFPNESLSEQDITHVQHIIDTYLYAKSTMTEGQTGRIKSLIHSFLLDLLTCEIEETLSPLEAKTESMYRLFAFQVMKEKIQFEAKSDEDSYAAVYVALEQAFSKSDRAYLRYHLFLLSQKPLSHLSNHEIAQQSSRLSQLFEHVDNIINNPYSPRISRYFKTQMAPFYILFQIISDDPDHAESTISDRELLWKASERVSRQKYESSHKRLKTLGLKAIIYIFLTKMILAFILEFPVSQLLFHEVNYFALAVNTLLPPLIMFLIIAVTHTPSSQNTLRIYERIIGIVNSDMSYEKTIAYRVKPARKKRPVLVLAFSIFYLFTFVATFGLLYEALLLAQFNIISQLIFFFFVCMVTFFGYRVRQTAKEYHVYEREHIMRPLFDFFFMPVLSVGKFLSKNVSKLNFLTVIFDFIIEAPFKLLVEVVEEWVKFVRQKREEIV